MNTTNATAIAQMVYKGAIGLIAGLFGNNAPNTMACTSNFTRIANYSIALVEDIKLGTNVSLAQSAIDFENIFASVHPIVFGCYTSAFEFKNITVSYVDTFKDWKNMLISVAHKAGDIYDVIMFIINGIKAKADIFSDEGAIEWWYKEMLYFGITLKMILDHPPADFYK